MAKYADASISDIDSQIESIDETFHPDDINIYKSIDVVWNGMTLTDEVKAAMECTNAYCNNAQVVVVAAE